MAAQKTDINLLQQKDFEATTVGRVMAWALSSFRVIVIITEIIVMLAFFSRFRLDTQNSDLNEQIRQKQAVIEASSDFEKEFRNIQSRLKIFSDMTTNADISSKVLKAINTHIPPDTLLTKILLNQNQVELTGISPSERNIQQFMANLGSNDMFEKVRLTELAFNQQNTNLLVFKLSVTYKKTDGDSQTEGGIN